MRLELEFVTVTVPEVASTGLPFVSGELNSILTLLFPAGSVNVYVAMAFFTVIDIIVLMDVPGTNKLVPETVV